MIRTLALLCLLLSGIFSPLAATLPAAISQLLIKDRIDPSRVSIYITPTKSSSILVAHRIDAQRKPASVIKLATTYSALLEFGPGWRWPTRFFYTGTFRDGTITGDLVVKAYGDPTLSCKDLPKIVERLRRIGVRKIEGDLIIDRSFFAVDDRISSGFDNHPYSEYNAMPEALMFDDHLCRIIVDPTHGTVEKKIPDPGFQVIDRLQYNDKACRGRYSWPRVHISREGELSTVTLEGTLSRRCRPRTVKAVLSHPYQSFTAAFLQELKAGGITLEGRMRLAKLPAGARELMTHYAAPLQKILAKTNKHSNNLYARHIFLLLGAKRLGAPATVAKGRKAVREILGARGILGEETILDNGCGLSRRTRTTARALHRLLEDAYRRYAWTWMGTLAIAGMDGTVKRRFRNSPVRRRAWVKTGTLKDAKNIAGYVKGRSGKLYTVVILYNGPERWKGALLENQILEWIVKNK